MKTVAISKFLEDVWIWKERCYDDSKGLSVKDYLNKVHKHAEKTLKETGFVEKDGKLKKVKGSHV